MGCTGTRASDEDKYGMQIQLTVPRTAFVVVDSIAGKVNPSTMKTRPRLRLSPM